jgi:hypothetical protein
MDHGQLPHLRKFYAKAAARKRSDRHLPGLKQIKISVQVFGERQPVRVNTTTALRCFMVMSASAPIHGTFGGVDFAKKSEDLL